MSATGSAASAPESLWRSPGFCALTLANVLEGACFYGIATLLTLYLPEKLALPDAAVGRMVGTYLGGVTLLMFPGGAVCDRWGALRALRWGLLLLALGRTALLCSSTGAAAWLALLLMAAGTGVVLPSVYAGVRSTLSPAQATPGYAWLYGLMNGGVVVWMLLSPSVRAQGGAPAVFSVLTGLSWLNAAVQFLLAGVASTKRAPALETAPRPLASEPAPPTYQAQAQFQAQDQDKFPCPARSDVEQPLLSASFLLFISALFPVRCLLAHLTLTFPTYVKRIHPALAPQLEHCFALNFALQFVGALALARAATGSGPLVWGSLVSALAAFLLCWPGHPDWSVWAFMALFSLGEAWWQTRFYEQVARRAPLGQTGRAMSLANLPWFVAKTTAGFYSGWMLSHFAAPGGPDRSDWIWAPYGALACLTPLLLLAGGALRKGSPGEPRNRPA